MSKSEQEQARVSKPKKELAAAGAQMQLARDHFADFRLAASCCVFFPLGFKFCCMVLRVANARALIIDLRRLCHVAVFTMDYNSSDSEKVRYFSE